MIMYKYKFLKSHGFRRAVNTKSVNSRTERRNSTELNQCGLVFDKITERGK